jgi:hypothetical protein
MKPTVIAIALCFAAGAQSADPGEIEKLKAQLAEQRTQLETLRRAIEEQQKIVDRLSQPSLRTAAAPAAPQAEPAPAAPGFPRLAGNVASSAPMLTGPLPRPQKSAAPMPDAQPPAPLSWDLGVARFTPLGFVDLTEVYRSTAVGSGIGTNFNALPFDNSVAGRLSESRLSLQNSRLGFLLDSTILGWTTLGYLETDFLGNAPANLSVSANSDTLRLRLFFVDTRKGKFEFLGGQSWSLLTPNRQGLSPMPTDIFYSQDMDPNYQIGLTWTRAPQARIVYHFNDNVAWGVSAENSAQFLGASSAPVVPTALSSSYTAQFETGANATSTPNLTPDLISKIAFDGNPGGHAIHAEIAGLFSTFHAYNPLTGIHFNTAGGGGAFNSNLEVFKNFRLIENLFWSDGGGRYLFGSGPDLAIRADGGISPMHAGSTVDGFEWKLSPKDNPKGMSSLLYAYYGGAYYGRDVIADATAGALAGYGYNGSPNSQNRAIQEGTLGLIQTLWRNSAWGDFKLITQYSYIWRSPWYVAAGAPKNARSNMVLIDLRYDIP